MEIAAAVEKMTAILPELARNGLAPAGSSSLGPWVTATANSFRPPPYSHQPAHHLKSPVATGSRPLEHRGLALDPRQPAARGRPPLQRQSRWSHGHATNRSSQPVAAGRFSGDQDWDAGEPLVAALLATLVCRGSTPPQPTSWPPSV